MDNWTKLRKLYVEDQKTKDGLSTRQRRSDAMESMHEFLTFNLPHFVNQPKFLNKIPKDEFIQMIRDKKGSPLNSSEKSVVNALYKYLPELETVKEEEE